jgi:hypothetical protein
MGEGVLMVTIGTSGRTVSPLTGIENYLRLTDIKGIESCQKLIFGQVELDS